MSLPKAKEIVDSNPVVVFSRTYCPFCLSVKKLLTEIGASYKAIELDNEDDGSQLQAALHEWTAQSTVPNVFIGCDATTAMHKSGKLIPVLTEAGAVAKSSA